MNSRDADKIAAATLHLRAGNSAVLAPSAAPTWPHRPANVRPAYQNTSDAIEIAAKALALAASNAAIEGAPPNVIAALRSNAARLCALRIEVMKGTQS